MSSEKSDEDTGSSDLTLMSMLARSRLDRHVCKCDVQKVHCDVLDLDFTVNIQNETSVDRGTCYILTIHDLGTSHTQFHDFVNDPICEAMRKRVIWLHIDLPGQEDNAQDLNIKKYPSLTDLARALVHVLDSANLKQAVILGDGLGANIAIRFAILYPDRCYGLILIRPTSTSAGIIETLREKETAQSVRDKSSRRRYSVSGPLKDSLRLYIVQEFKDMLYYKRNAKNLALLLDSFLSRENIEDDMDLIKCDVLTFAGRESPLFHTTEKFYDRFRLSRMAASGDNVQRMENSPFLAFDCVTDILLEVPEKLVSTMQLFLQGLGLITGMPLANFLPGLGRQHRSLSMDIDDAPSPQFLQYRKSYPK